MKQLDTPLKQRIRSTRSQVGGFVKRFRSRSGNRGKRMVSINRKYFAQAMVLLFATSADAADIASDVSAGSGAPNNSNGGYFEFGVDMNLLATSEGGMLNAGVLLAGAYRYRGFFFEAVSPGVSLNDESGGISGISAGFNLWRNNQWTLDLLAASSTWRLSTGKIKTSPNDSSESELEKAVLDRDTFYNGAGIRLTGYYDDTIFQFRLVDDTHGGKGIIGSARIGYSRQFKNWNLHSFVGATYISEETGQYWYGVSDDEASERFPEYQVGSSAFVYTGEIGATYPLRENVIFRSTARYTRSDSEIANSPLQEGDFGIRWNNSLSYVF